MNSKGLHSPSEVRIMNTYVRSSALRLSLIVVAVFSLLSSVSLFGQAVNGTIVGTVTDATGAVVANAKVTITEQADTNVSHAGNSNESGNFIFADLPPGNYSVTVEMTGFKKEQRRNIALLVNTTQRVDIQLQPGNVTESVEVTGAPPALQTDRADTGRNIDSMVVSELPVLVSNRNYQALLALVPGTSPPTEEHSQFFNASDSLQTEVNGAPRVSNNYQIEGIDDNERTGLLQILIPPLEAITTVDISTSNHSVDLGRGAGAVTNVILKSGTNQFHGSLYEFVQNGDFDARNFFQPSVAAVHYNYFGGTIGGPIKKNKLFFFADFLRYHRSRSQRQHRDDTVAAVAHRQLERGAGWLQPRPGLRSGDRRSDHRSRKDSIPRQHHSHIAPEPDRAQDPGPGAQSERSVQHPGAVQQLLRPPALHQGHQLHGREDRLQHQRQGPPQRPLQLPASGDLPGAHIRHGRRRCQWRFRGYGSSEDLQ